MFLAPTTCLSAVSATSLIVTPCGVYDSEQEQFDIFNVILHEQLRVDDVFIAGNHQRLGQYRGRAPDAQLQAPYLSYLDCTLRVPIGAGQNQCRPGPSMESNLPSLRKAACSPGCTW